MSTTARAVLLYVCCNSETTALYVKQYIESQRMISRVWYNEHVIVKFLLRYPIILLFCTKMVFFVPKWWLLYQDGGFCTKMVVNFFFVFPSRVSKIVVYHAGRKMVVLV